MKPACHTNPTSPSQSLTEVIAYPEAFKLSNICKYFMGCRQAKAACDAVQCMTDIPGFSVVDIGRALNSKRPHIVMQFNA